MKKPIKTALLRDLEIQLSKEEISYSRMVEILNEKAVEYARECSQASLEKASMSVINERLESTNKGDYLLAMSITNPDNIVLI